MRYIPPLWQERKCLSRLVAVIGLWLKMIELINLLYLQVKQKKKKKINTARVKAMATAVRKEDTSQIWTMGAGDSKWEEIGKGQSLNRQIEH